MDLIPDFIHRMHGGEFEYLHPLLEKVLEPTYGIMVYQEQVMQAAQFCAEQVVWAVRIYCAVPWVAENLRKWSSSARSCCGSAAGKDIDEATANHIFDYMEKFAGYGFNKSHAAAYALVAYQTAWLRLHYPAELMSAVMT